MAFLAIDTCSSAHLIRFRLPGFQHMRLHQSLLVLRGRADRAQLPFCHMQEVGILKGLNYDRNIVQFYGACIREGADPLLITEYMEGGPASALE
jgi:Protein tyrosine and serine/threonine kinase